MPMLIPERVRNLNMIRSVLLALAVLSMLCGLLAAGTLGLGRNAGLFHATVLVENHSDERLTITPITTTYAEPRVIEQGLTVRQRDQVLEPNDSMLLTYDTADFPLAGIVVCRQTDCRALEPAGAETVAIDNFDTLPKADESWLAAVNTSALYNYAGITYISLLVLSMILFGIWWWIGKTKYNFG